MKKENFNLREQYKKVTGKEFNLEEFLNKETEIEEKTEETNPKVKAKSDLDDSLKLMRNEVSTLKHNSLGFELQTNNLKTENEILMAKINNLENIFIGSNIVRNKDGSVFNNVNQDYNLSTVLIFF